MSLAKIFTLKSQKLQDRDNEYGWKRINCHRYVGSEPPFDPMEIALHEIYTKVIALQIKGLVLNWFMNIRYLVNRLWWHIFWK
jgi:hypothetical protein